MQRLVAEGGAQGNPLNLKINHGGKIYELGEGIGDRNTVGALKELVGYHYPYNTQLLRSTSNN